MIEFAQDFLLEQIILEPTRGDNILDLCFTSHHVLVHQYKIAPGFSNHDAVIIEKLQNISINKRPKKCVHCYNSTDWDAIREELTEISRYYFKLNGKNNRSVEENCDSTT